MKAGKIAYGTDMCLEKIKFNKAKILIVAEDASNNTKEKLTRICEEKKIALYEYGSKEELSMAIGKANKTVIAILDVNFAKSIKNYLEESKGEIF